MFHIDPETFLSLSLVHNIVPRCVFFTRQIHNQEDSSARLFVAPEGYFWPLHA